MGPCRPIVYLSSTFGALTLGGSNLEFLQNAMRFGPRGTNLASLRPRREAGRGAPANTTWHLDRRSRKGVMAMNVELKDQMVEVLDVDDLLGRCLGNVEFAQRILGKFQERCDEDLKALEKAVSDRDSEAVARLAHRLKGASANASAPGLQKHASEIEHAARHESIEQVPASLENLKQEWARFGEAVSQLGSLADTPN